MVKISNIFLQNLSLSKLAVSQKNDSISIFNNTKQNCERNTDKMHKKIAKDILNQIEGVTLNNKTTLKKLSQINSNNAAEVISEYKKISNRDLATDILDEWSILNKLDIQTIKKYLCKPLKEQALSLKLAPISYDKINDTDELNEYIKNLSEQIQTIKHSKHTKSVNKDDTNSPFEPETILLMDKKVKHKTKLLDIAQENLGLQEVTSEELKKLSDDEKLKTQWKIIKDIDTTKFDYSWCAYTVSYLCKQAGIDIGGTKAEVVQFINWAKSPNSIVKYNEINEQKDVVKRKAEIELQLKQMKEGDFIIWKSPVLKKIEHQDSTVQTIASHIGIIESVKNGIITVLEGNANITYNPNNEYDAVIAQTVEEAAFGNQHVGKEPKEINYRDGLIRKQYTTEELAKDGYSGFIDTQTIVK